jgi:hypothetical protein
MQTQLSRQKNTKKASEVKETTNNKAFISELKNHR